MSDLQRLGPRVNIAIEFAMDAHKGQIRKYSNEPYIVHPIEVAEIVWLAGGDENQICAALLHDVVEDCEVSLVTINKIFGDDVAQLVDDLTKKTTSADGNRSVRKLMEEKRLANISPRAKMVKLADLISNTKNIKESDPSFARVYLNEIESLLTVLKDGGSLWEKANSQVNKAIYGR